MNRPRDFVDTIAHFAARQRFDRTPDRVRALAKLHVIDGIAAMLSGAAKPGVRSAHRRLLGGGDEGGAEVIGSEGAAAAAQAAFANTLSGRLSDFDDVQTTERSLFGLLVHPTVPVLAAALAVGQWRKVSGEALLVAYLVGVEIAARLAETIHPDVLRRGFPTTAICGGLGALFAAAKLVGLPPKAIRAAVALWRTAVPTDAVPAEPAATFAWREAHAVRSAVEAVLLAADGAISEAAPGAPLAIPGLRAVQDTVKGWGAPPLILEPGFAVRALPCHPLMHPALDLVFAIVNLHDLKAVDIARIEIGTTSVVAETLAFKPPTSAADLRRNLPFAAALAAVKGHLAPEDFGRMPQQKATRALMARVVCRVDAALDALGAIRAPVVVRVRLRNRRVIEMKTDVAKGSPQKPFSEIELFHKFFQCALATFEGPQAERLLNRLWLIDEAPAVAGLCRLDVRWPSDVEGNAHRGHDPHDHGREHHAHLGHDDHDHFHDHPHEHGHAGQSHAHPPRAERRSRQAAG